MFADAAGRSRSPAYRGPVTEIREVVACPACGTFWPLGGEAACADPAHDHRRHELHRHRTALRLPDGTEVVAVSYDAADPHACERPPDYGLYLDARWRPPWPHEHADWPDFGVPPDPDGLATALRGVLRRARAGQRVEVGCAGGHGRTGTALACLAVLCGHPPAGAVAWVRAAYCARAVETPGQEAFVAAFRPPAEGPDRPAQGSAGTW